MIRVGRFTTFQCPGVTERHFFPRPSTVTFLCPAVRTQVEVCRPECSERLCNRAPSVARIIWTAAGRVARSSAGGPIVSASGFAGGTGLPQLSPFPLRLP